MKELSLHILDIAKNAVRANANRIDITVFEDIENDSLSIVIKDNGCGMSEGFLKKVRDPFTTTKTTRKVGLGIPLFETAALQNGGEFSITSKENIGTEVKAVFVYSNADRAPLGDIAETIITLISGSPEIRFVYTYKTNNKEFVFDTKEVKKQLGSVSIANAKVLNWICEYIREEINEK